MKTLFPASFTTSLDDFWRAVCLKLRHNKEVTEIHETLDVLQVWQGLFTQKYGELQSLVHYSNPDDPPDVLAKFSLYDLEIEHTEIEPAHVKQADAIHKREANGAGRNAMPISGCYSPAKQKEIMWTPCHPNAWENQDANLHARFDLMISTIQTKICKHPPGGLLILKADVGCFPAGFDGEIEMIKHAVSCFLRFQDSDKWMVAVHNRWNSCEFFSVLFTSRTGLMMQRKDINGLITKPLNLPS